MAGWQQSQSQYNDHHCYRQVDDEQPLPDGEGHDDTAQDRADQKGQPKDGPDQAKGTAAFLGREGIANNRTGDREDTAGTEAL